MEDGIELKNLNAEEVNSKGKSFSHSIDREKEQVIYDSTSNQLGEGRTGNGLDESEKIKSNNDAQIELQSIGQKNETKIKRIQDPPQEKKETKEEKPTSCMEMPNCLKHLDIIRERKLSIQVGIVYTIFMIIFIVAIGFAKIIQINSLLETQADKNYYTSIVTDMIDVQRQVKVQLDAINNDDYLTGLNSPLIFMRIYMQEMISHKLLDSKVFESIGTIDYNSVLGENNKESKKFKIDFSNIFQDNDVPCFANLFPFLVHYIPIFYQTLKLQGIPMMNFYFLAYDKNDESKKVYLKYPLESEDGPTNDKPYDFILDPIGEQWIDDIKGSGTSTGNNKGDEDLKKKIQNNNWFYHLQSIIFKNREEKVPNSSMFSMVKVTEDNKREDYFMNYYVFQDPNDEDNVLMIAMKLLKTEMVWPYIQLDKNNDTLKFDYFSILNYRYKIDQITINNADKVYEWDYNIDDGKNLIVNNPKFISNIYQYAMILNKVVEEEENGGAEQTINENSLLLKYSKMETIKKDFNINYNFDHDTNFFKLITFLNNFLNYYHYNLPPLDVPLNDNPCEMDDINGYYKSIKKYVDCMKDYCFYNKCNLTSKLYVEPEKSNFMPNCYCIPLYCRNELSNTADLFHTEIVKVLGLESNSYKYSFTNIDYDKSEEDEYQEKYLNSMVGKYFNFDDKEFKCKISFLQKNELNTETFNARIKVMNTSFDGDRNMFTMFLMSNSEIYNIIAEFKSLVNDIKWIIYLVYFVCLSLVGVFLICFLIYQVNKLTQRMGKIKEIRTKIISGNNIEKRTEDTSSESEKKENDSLIENEKSENDKDKENDKETDELSALKNLIIDNIKDFKIEFNLNENMNSSINLIEKQYNEIIKVNNYKNKLLPKTEEVEKKEDTYENLSEYSMNESSQSSSQKEGKDNVDDLSLKIFYELLSLSTSEVDFSKTKTNFYFKEDFSKSILNLDDAINSIETKDTSNTNEITNQEKLENAINYYKNEIHSFWKEKYDEQKKKDDI